MKIKFTNGLCWHRWFAWRPVFFNNRLVWLCCLERRLNTENTFAPYWQYKIPVNDNPAALHPINGTLVDLDQIITAEVGVDIIDTADLEDVGVARSPYLALLLRDGGRKRIYYPSEDAAREALDGLSAIGR